MVGGWSGRVEWEDKLGGWEDGMVGECLPKYQLHCIFTYIRRLQVLPTISAICNSTWYLDYLIYCSWILYDAEVIYE